MRSFTKAWRRPETAAAPNHRSSCRSAELDRLGYVGYAFHTDHEWIDLLSITPRLYPVIDGDEPLSSRQKVTSRSQG